MKPTSVYSAVVIARNEARTIKRCLDALMQITDDIVIVLDDRSDDDTLKIAQEVGVTIYKTKWKGFSANKNFGAEKTKNQWILCPDADEILNEELIKNIMTLKLEENEAYAMNRRTWFGDTAVRYSGWFPDWNIRLYNKNKMSWNANQVHEKLESTSPINIKKIQGIIEHLSFRDENHMISKFDHYARMRANEWVDSGKKLSWLKTTFGPAFRMFKTYVIKLGFLDGKVGYTIAKNEYYLKRKEINYFQKFKKVRN